MSSQNDMLKKDILDVLSKQMSGGGDTREAYQSSNVPKTKFGLGGAKKPKKVLSDFEKKEKALLDKLDFTGFDDVVKDAFTKDELEQLTKKPAKKSGKKNPAKQPKKDANPRIDPLHQVSKEDAKKSKSVKKPDANCNSAKNNAQSVMRFYNIHDGKIKNSDFKSKKDFNETIMKLVDMVDDVRCDAYDKSIMKEALELYNKKNPSKKPATHKMPDGSIHTGKTHTKDSKVVKPAPKKQAKTTSPVSVSKTGKITKQNPWIEYVKQYSKDNNISYTEAVKLAGPSYKAQKKATTNPKNKIRKFNVVKKLPNKEVDDIAKPKNKIRKFKVVDSLEKRILDIVEEKSQLTDKELEDKILLIVAEQQFENMKPRKCPPNKELNPKTNRCKKVVKKRNVKGKSPWLKFLDKFRAENPQIKGKDVMKQASIAYKDVIVPHPVDSESEDELPPPPDKLLDEDYAKTLPAPEDNKFNPPPRPFFKAKDGLIQIPEKTQNQILADVLDSYDNFNAEFEKVANSDMVRSFKQQEFNKIMDRAFEFNEKILTTLNKSLDPLSRKRAEDAFNHTRMSFTEGYKNLKSGHDQVEFSDYEDDEFVQKIIDEELEYDPTALDKYSAIRDEDNRRQEEEREPVITEQVNLSSKDNLPIELQVDVIEEGDGEMNENDAIKLYQEIENFDENIERELLESEERDRKEKEKIEGFYYEEFNKLEKERKLERALKKIRERKQQYERNRIELTEFEDAEEFDEDDLDEILDEVNYNYFSDDELEWDDADLDFIQSDEEITYDTMLNIIDEEEENDLQYSRKPSLYPNNVLADENSIQPTSLDNSNMLPRVSRADIRELKKSAPRLPTIIEEDEEEKKPTRKRPINLRLYQEFLKLMRKNDPSLSRDDITALWKSNKNAYIDMLMDVVDLSGGNLLNDEHYFNAFRNIGGVMLGGAFSGTGNTMYQMKHQAPKFDRSVYDKVNNPYGIGKTHAEQAPRLPTTESNKSSVEQDLEPFKPDWTKGQFVDDEGIDMTDLSDPRAWGKTFENIGTGVYKGLKSVAKILSPLSWLP